MLFEKMYRSIRKWILLLLIEIKIEILVMLIDIKVLYVSDGCIIEMCWLYEFVCKKCGFFGRC